MYTFASYPSCGVLAYLGLPGRWEIVVIILAVILLFWARKIPGLSESIGQVLRGFTPRHRDTTHDDSFIENQPHETSTRKNRHPDQQDNGQLN